MLYLGFVMLLKIKAIEKKEKCIVVQNRFNVGHHGHINQRIAIEYLLYFGLRPPD